MNKEYIAFLAKQLMFELNEDELAMIEEDFATLNKQFALLDEIDTSSIAAMVFPWETETEYMREDVVNDIMESSEVLRNAVNVKDGLFEVAKVANR